MVDWVRDTGRPILLTRYGEPVAEVVPLPSIKAPATLMGFGQGNLVVPPGFDIKAEDLFEGWESDLLDTWEGQPNPVDSATGA